MACAHKFLSSSVNNVTHISAFTRNLILFSRKSRRKKNPRIETGHNQKSKILTRKKKLTKKINLSKSQEKQTQHSQVFLNLIYFCWRKLIANHIFFNYYFINSSSLYFISRWGVLFSRSITIFRNIKSVLLVVPSSSLMHFRGWYSSRPAREEKSQT